ncbi:MAG: hypothetical protein GX445_04760 [Elusimicrobia bacterium]|nr:hypothetical protein [Elusimicrobiota bacterium]
MAMILKVFIMSGMMALADDVLISTQDNIVLISSETERVSVSLNTSNQLLKLVDDIKNQISGREILDNDRKQIEDILSETQNKISYVLKESGVEKKETDYNKALIKVRKALMDYFIKTNRYPKNIEELVPYFTDFIPEIDVHNEFNSRIKYIRTRDFDKNYSKAVDNSSEYLYFADPQSLYWGLFIINSNRMDKSGTAFYEW